MVIYDLPVSFDVAAAAATAPRLLRRPLRAVANRFIGRNPIPEPVAARLARLGPRGRARYQLPYTWDPTYPARVGVLPREGSANQIRWFDVEPCYVFHALNA